MSPFLSLPNDQQQVIESEPVDIEELVDWLDQLWQSDEEIRNSTSEEDWLEFLETIKSSQ